MLLLPPVSRFDWKKSTNDIPSTVVPSEAGNSSPRYLAFWAALPASKLQQHRVQKFRRYALILPTGIESVWDLFVRNETPVDAHGVTTGLPQVADGHLQSIQKPPAPRGIVESCRNLIPGSPINPRRQQTIRIELRYYDTTVTLGCIRVNNSSHARGEPVKLIDDNSAGTVDPGQRCFAQQSLHNAGQFARIDPALSTAELLMNSAIATLGAQCVEKDRSQDRSGPVANMAQDSCDLPREIVL